MRSRLDYPGRVAATATAAAAAAAAVAFVVGALLATRAAAAPPSPRKNAAAEKKKKKKKKNASGFSFVKRIILVRHGESLGNADHSAYQRIGDNVIPLTETGLAQARARGRAIRARGEIKGVFRVYYSPYLRARQTALEVVRGICGGDERMCRRVAMRSDPRLREQDFGNLQSSEGPHAMKTQQRARAKFGRFWYRFQNGESGADVYDRIGNFFGTLTRARGLVRDPAGGGGGCAETTELVQAETIVLVTHGLSMRLFLMRYFRWNVSEFEKVWNPRNCERWVLDRAEGHVPFSFASFAQVRYGPEGRELPVKMRYVRTASDPRGWPGSSAYEMLRDEVEQDLGRLEQRKRKEGSCGGEGVGGDEDKERSSSDAVAHRPGASLRKMSVFA